MKKVYLETPEAVIKALKEEKEVFLDEGGAGKVVLIDGFCVKQWHDQFNINYTINLRDKPYILEEEPLKIEVGKFYKTRDGRKAFVCANTYTGLCWVVIIDSSADRTFCCTVDGMFCPGEENEKDLVAPWEEDK